jgi:hypothetical protein
MYQGAGCGLGFDWGNFFQRVAQDITRGFNYPSSISYPGKDDAIDIGYRTGVETACPKCESSIIPWVIGALFVGYFVATSSKKQK